MKKIMRRIITGCLGGALSLMLSNLAIAGGCISSDCAAMGYTKTVTQCSDFEMIRCPFDTSKVFCQEEEICPGYQKLANCPDYLPVKEVCPDNENYIKCSMTCEYYISEEGTPYWNEISETLGTGKPEDFINNAQNYISFGKKNAIFTNSISVYTDKPNNVASRIDGNCDPLDSDRCGLLVYAYYPSYCDEDDNVFICVINIDACEYYNKDNKQDVDDVGHCVSTMRGYASQYKNTCLIIDKKNLTPA